MQSLMGTSPADGKEARRLRALVPQGGKQVAGAEALGITPGAVRPGVRKARPGGVPALHRRPRPGRWAPRHDRPRRGHLDPGTSGPDPPAGVRRVLRPLPGGTDAAGVRREPERAGAVLPGAQKRPWMKAGPSCGPMHRGAVCGPRCGGPGPRSRSSGAR